MNRLNPHYRLRKKPCFKWLDRGIFVATVIVTVCTLFVTIYLVNDWLGVL